MMFKYTTHFNLLITECHVCLTSKHICAVFLSFFFQAEDGIRDAQESRGLGDVYKRQELFFPRKGKSVKVDDKIF